MSKLHVSRFTNGNQSSIIALLHGWGSSSKIWHPFIDELSSHFEIWCIDLPGHGESQAIDWDSSVEQGMSLLADALPLECSIVGWSLGGLWGQMYLQRFPERIKELLLISSTPKFVACESWKNGMTKEKFEQFYTNFTQKPHKTLQQFFILQTLNEKNAKGLIRALSKSTITKDFHNISWGLDWLENIDLRDAQIANRDNVYLMQGENDQVTSVAMAYDTEAIFNNWKLLNIVDAGHAPFLSHQKIFIDCVVNLK